MINGLVIIASLLIAQFYTTPSWANESTSVGYYSDDLEAYGGESGAYSGGGSGVFNDIEAIRASPALIASSQDYRIGASFHWPTFGRSFYQAGVVDGTSTIKAGFLYTAPLNRSYQDPHEDSSLLKSYTHRQAALWGMRTIQKFNLTLAQALGDKLMLGITGAYIQGMQRPYRSFKLEPTNGVTLGFGLAAHITPTITLAAAVENLNNHALTDLAPIIYRVGGSGTILKNIVRLYADYLHRERVRSEWVLIHPKNTTSEPNWQSLFEHRSSLSAYEQSIVGGIEVTLEKMLRLIGSYRHEVSTNGFDRQSFGGGISINSELYKISYTIKQSNLNHTKLHQTVSLHLTFEIGSSSYTPTPTR